MSVSLSVIEWKGKEIRNTGKNEHRDTKTLEKYEETRLELLICTLLCDSLVCFSKNYIIDDVHFDSVRCIVRFA